MRFSDFLGNEAAKTVLLRGIEDENALRHAYLLTGAKGTGKRTLADLFIRALFCKGETPPCGECLPCKKIIRQIHPDVFVLRPSEGKDSISVESVRALKEFLYLLPNEAEKKAVLIENAEGMTSAAANALLKMLEEPPSYAVFVLLAENRSLLLETISSRCLVLPLFEPGTKRVKEALSSRYPDTSPEQMEQALLYGGGNLGKSISYLEQEEVRNAFEKAKAVFSGLDRGEFFLLRSLSEYERDREGFLVLLEDLIQICDVQIQHSGTLSASRFQAGVSPVTAARIYALCEQTAKRLRQNASLGITVAGFAGALSATAE